MTDSATRLTGILNVNKPPGVTSRRAVDCVQNAVRPFKAGHAGTLDPLATGVLVVCVGSATRLIEYVQRMHKKYRAAFLLGRTSETEDVEGEVVELADAPQPSEQKIIDASAAFVGEIMQRPPAFSALKVQGQRAHKLARSGKKVELDPRPVTVYRLDIIRYNYPELVVDVECSRGTYVRSLGRDLAESLGTGAVMSELVRTAIGGFRLEDGVALNAITSDSVDKFLQPPSTAVADLPSIQLTAAQLEAVRHGRKFPCNSDLPDTDIAALDATGNLVAIVRALGGTTVKPIRVFVDP